jgi:sarcosine oxidase subunit gamma
MPEIAARRSPAVATTAWLRLLPPAVRLAFFGDARARALAAGAWGVPFAEQPLRASRQGPRATLWVGPDEYLLLDTATDAPAELAAGIEAVLAGVPHALVDVSHRQIALEVSGPHAEDLLAGACPLDLDLGAFPIGMCTRTVFAKADILVWRTADAQFHVEVWRSFADYVTGLLGEIARDHYPTA